MKWWKENWWKIIGIIFIWLGGYFFGYTPKKCPTCPSQFETLKYPIGGKVARDYKFIDGKTYLNIITIKYILPYSPHHAWQKSDSVWYPDEYAESFGK